MAGERVTVTLPAGLELTRRRRRELLRSIANPHPEAVEVAKAGLAGWGAALPSDDDGLLEASSGQPVSWIEGKGWTRGPA